MPALLASTLASTSIGESLTTFVNAAGQFFSDLAAVHWGALVLGLVFFGLNLTLRSRAYFNTLRAAYPAVSFQWRRIWGAYFAAVGFNNVVPVRGGEVIKLFLTRSSIPGSSYPTVAAAFFVESIFDVCVGVLILIFAFTQGVFPKPPDFSKLSSFDISYLAGHFRFTLFLITALAILGLVAFALLSVRVRAFWARVRQGVTILSDRRRYLREVVSLQALGWMCRFAAFWFLLEAFRVGGSVGNVLLVFAVNQVAGAVPLTPGGGGCAAGAARQGLRRERRRHGGRGGLLGGPADRDRRVHGGRRARRGRAHLRVPLLRRSPPRRPRLARGRARRDTIGRGPLALRGRSTAAPSAQAARALLSY